MWKMDNYKLWLVLVGIRILSVFVPQSGYIHPDEFFQTTEVVAGDVLDVQHERTWEFTWNDPIRSIVLPYVLWAPLLFLLRLLNLATPYFVLVLPRLVVTAASIIVDRCVYLLCRKHNSDGYTSLLLYATSYVSWTYMTHTFSNTIETILFAVLLVITSGANETKRVFRTRRMMGQSSHDTVILATIITVGAFNRPTFLIFAFVPMLRWLWNLVSAEWKMSDRMQAFIRHVTAMSVTSLAISLFFILADTIYFRYESVRHIPKDLENCAFHDSSKMECLGKMYTTYRPSVVISPLAFFSYNTKSSNLSQHGSHPWFFHIAVSLPMLFGPAVVFVMWRMLKNILNVILGGSLKVNTEFHLDDVNMVSYFLFPLAAFSCVSHQEPRFLLPLVPVGLVIATKSISSFKTRSKRWMWSTTFIKFWVFNALAFLVVGFLHQGGIVPGISRLQNKVKAIKGESHVVFYHTYMAPQHLFLHPEDSEARLNVYNLGGASFEKLEKTMEKIRTIAASSKGDEWIGIWVVAPKTVVADVKQLKIKFGNVNKYWHLSFEDPPRVLGFLKREVSWSELTSDFGLVVAEVSSWKVFDSKKSSS